MCVSYLSMWWIITRPTFRSSPRGGALRQGPSQLRRIAAAGAQGIRQGRTWVSRWLQGSKGDPRGALEGHELEVVYNGSEILKVVNKCSETWLSKNSHGFPCLVNGSWVVRQQVLRFFMVLSRYRMLKVGEACCEAATKWGDPPSRSVANLK